LNIGSKRIPRPLFPQFIEAQPTGAQWQQGQDDDFTTYFREYEELAEEI